MAEWPSDGGNGTLGDLYLLPISPSEAEFQLSVRMADGTEIYFDSTSGPVQLRDGMFVWRHPSPDFNYTLTFNLAPEGNEGIPMENAIAVTEDTGGGAHPFNIDLSPDGYYYRDSKVFVTPEGYMYRISDSGSTCTLARGGLYSGSVVLPQSVKGPFGRMFRVTGIDTDAFKCSRGVTEVLPYDSSQNLAPGSLIPTEVPYSWESAPLPYYAYPDRSKTRFVIPYFMEFQRPQKAEQWVIFKQNLAPALQSKDSCEDQSKRDGRVDQDFDSTRGLYYTLQSDKDAVAKMFRGYDSMEIEALVADEWYVANHTFPSFSRWKFPENKIAGAKFAANEMSRLFGRPIMYSYRAAKLREGKGQLDIVEFEHVNHQAMVAFVWHDGSKIIAYNTLSTEIESEYEDYSVWNVDDDGTYGIPDVVTIAYDREGNVTIFLAKNSPESVTCYALQQEGGNLRKVNFDIWYRYVDI